MTRKLGSWTDAFNQYMSGKGSPSLFTKWAGIFAIAGAMERKIWIQNSRGQLHPTLYIMLVGPPGAGKTLAVKIVRGFLKELEDHHIAPSSVTKASLIDALAAAERKLIRPMDTPAIITFNSLTVTSNEMGVFMPAYDGEFMNTMTDLWDGEGYSETRRTAKINISMDSPQINFIAGTTPSYLQSFLPEGAWDQGFMSRCLIVYSGGNGPESLFNEVNYDRAMETMLIEDLEDIGKMYGKMTFSSDARHAIDAWHLAGGPPAPDHPKLLHYNIRRSAMLLKLCMIACASSGEDLVITLDHYAEAMDWLLETEARMSDVFKAMKNGGDARVIEECWHYAYTTWIKDKKPIHENRLYTFLNERTASHNVERILTNMEKAGLLERKFSEVGYGYIPCTKAA